MARLEELERGGSVRGILPDQLVTIVDVRRYGDFAVELTYKDASGRLGQEVLYHDRAEPLEIVAERHTWSFEGDGALLRLVSEAYRIHLAYLFDPLLAVHTSLVEPLPHQITAVYEEMLTRQPLRYLLADDPGAGKTIMAGLLIKELLLRGDVRRCLIVCPGNLVEQWQDELGRRFDLPFEILTNDKLDAARTGNWFAETSLAIARLDKLSRDDGVQAKLEAVDWDLVVCDEAHKMSASFFGGEVSYTKRYRLGQLLSRVARHFLLLTATPHNGKETDFQLFMALLDPDRFEGRFRQGVHAADTSDLMRRLVKERLLRFDGTPLFPERLAYTVNYQLSEAEQRLYSVVTNYVREEFNRADAISNEGRRGTIGFALTILQRRLASSPEAIYQSLRRRKERLQARLQQERGRRPADALAAEPADAPGFTADVLDDLDDAPDAEVEDLEARVVDQATAARTVAELEAEIRSLADLETLALQVRRSGTDRKWEQLSSLLQNEPAMFGADGHRRKLVIFTEHRDTLSYLQERITTLLGRPETVVVIHGGVRRDERRAAQEAFTQDPQTMVLLATDAAGEGINLQRAHLMVNYDLPWNPNRLEQRFGRIHRIGQTEVCHLWNLVANETREGEVYLRLLRKLDEERKALGGQVFDVLGKVTFGERPLRALLLEAVRYGDRPDVRARLSQVVDEALDRDKLIALLDERALAHETMDAGRVSQIRADMERAEARRLQPHYVASFFLEAFRQLAGQVREREPRRYEVSFVPQSIRAWQGARATGEPILPRYERITFQKELINVPGKPVAAFVCPGHPLLDAVTDLILQRHRDLLTRGAVLVDPADPGEAPRVMCFIEHAIQDTRIDASGNRRVISRQLQFVEIDTAGAARAAGAAPYLDYRPPTADERALVELVLHEAMLNRNVEQEALGYAIQHLVPGHFEAVRLRREALVAKTMAAVKERLTKEITYWDRRAQQLRVQEQAGRTPRVNAARAQQRADELEGRLTRRMEELEQERRLAPLPPVVLGGALVVPGGLLARLTAGRVAEPDAFARERKRVELLAMDAVMRAEQDLGCLPRDVSAAKVGYDVESCGPDGRLRFIEVKGRVQGADSVTVTRNEILTALNKPDDWILALVEVPSSAEFPEGDAYFTGIRDKPEPYNVRPACVVRYVRRPFTREPDFAATSVNYDLGDLWVRGESPYQERAERSTTLGAPQSESSGRA